jgi:hypothetical protein
MAMYKWLRLVLALVMVGMTAGSVLADNILLNSDMEEGPDETTAFPTTFGAWNATGTTGAYLKDAAAAHSGENYFYNYRGAYVWQCALGVVGGTEYTLSAWVKPQKWNGTTPWDEGEGIKFEVIWFATETANYGDSGALQWDIAMIFYTPEESGYGVWAQTSGTVTAPASAKCAVVKVGARVLGVNKNWCGFDDITMTPEPTTMCLLGLGSLALLRKRK